jgi:hypothetical protein
MKKILMTLAAVLCCAMTTTIFTACSSDDGDNNNKKPVDPPTSGEMECKLYTTDESLASFDFYVKYYDESGNIQSEKLVWTDQTNLDDVIVRVWTKKVVAKLPATLGILFEIKAKDGLDPNGQYILSRGYDITFTSKTASGNRIDIFAPNKKFSSGRNSVGMLEEVLKEKGRPLDIIYKFDANGKGLGTSKWE